MHRLYEMDFWYVLLGCPFSRTTALHTAEELMQVPYRRYRDFAGSTVVRADDTSAPSRSVEFLCIEPYHPDFTSVAPTFEAAGIQRSTTVGNARIVNAKTRDLVDLAVAKLTDDIAWLLADDCKQRFRKNRAELEADAGAGAPSFAAHRDSDGAERVGDGTS